MWWTYKPFILPGLQADIEQGLENLTKLPWKFQGQQAGPGSNMS